MKHLLEIKGDELHVNFHPGQSAAIDSCKRFVFVLAGTQGGKTEFGVLWLLEEIKKRGDGDYMVVSPSYPLQQKKVLPVYEDVFKYKLQLGTYKYSDRVFELSRKGFNSKVYFGSADNPDSLESCTAKAAHLDEVGQKSFRLSSWEAVQRRLSIHEGRVLGTTTVYNLGWMKTEIYDKWKNGDPDIHVIQFPSVMNPAFPRAEYERAKRTLPLWKFRMFYEGQYDRPAGLIYDSFDSEICVINPIQLDPAWPRHRGFDFGGVHTAVLWYAEHKVNSEVTNYYLYREYLDGGKTAKEHVDSINSLSEGENILVNAGGSGSEDQWRKEYDQFGIPIRKPKIKDVEVGIDRVYGQHKLNRIFVFNTCKGYIEQKQTYSRELDESGQPTEKIDDKEKFHFMDAERYIISELVQNEEPATPIMVIGRER